MSYFFIHIKYKVFSYFSITPYMIPIHIREVKIVTFFCRKTSKIFLILHVFNIILSYRKNVFHIVLVFSFLVIWCIDNMWFIDNEIRRESFKKREFMDFIRTCLRKTQRKYQSAEVMVRIRHLVMFSMKMYFKKVISLIIKLKYLATLKIRL